MQDAVARTHHTDAHLEQAAFYKETKQRESLALESVAGLQKSLRQSLGECVRSTSKQHRIHVISGQFFIDEKTNRRTIGRGVARCQQPLDQRCETTSSGREHARREVRTTTVVTDGLPQGRLIQVCEHLRVGPV